MGQKLPKKVLDSVNAIKNGTLRERVHPLAPVSIEQIRLKQEDERDTKIIQKLQMAKDNDMKQAYLLNKDR